MNSQATRRALEPLQVRAEVPAAARIAERRRENRKPLKQLDFTQTPAVERRRVEHFKPLLCRRAGLTNEMGNADTTTHRRVCQPHGTGLGVFRWVAKRTISWLHGFRRLRIRWERRDDIHEPSSDSPPASSPTATSNAFVRTSY